jgi:hypothetical protein
MKRSRNELKGYFESGDKPTQTQFADLIDSFFHEEDGKIVTSIDESDPENKIINFSDGTNITLSSAGNGDIDVAAVSGISKAFADGVRDDILRNDGNAAKTVLTVMNTTSGKVQIASLGGGNEVVAYLTGEDLVSGNVQERVFLELGEIYIFENLQNGSRIVTSEGAYGFSEQVSGSNMSPMPLGCNAFAFTQTFFYGFRNFGNGDGKIYVANGAVESVIELTDGSGTVVQGQTNIQLAPYAFIELDGDGNKEYILHSTNPISAALTARMSNNSFYDSRLIMPLTNDGMTWPRSGFMSALYSNTKVRFWVRDGVNGELATIDPGSPVDIDAAQPTGTGASDSDYEPNGATRFKAAGLVSAYSGADSAGLEATPMFPVSGLVQRVALPIFVQNSGDGGDNGLAFCSPYEGTVKVYQWNQATSTAELWLTIPLTRNNGGVNTPEDQLFPAAALASANASEATVVFPSDFLGGYAEADVPIHCVINSQNNQNQTFRGTSGDAVAGISSNDDETASTGITPEEIRVEITKDNATGLLLKRTIANTTQTWEVA